MNSESGKSLMLFADSPSLSFHLIWSFQCLHSVFSFSVCCKIFACKPHVLICELYPPLECCSLVNDFSRDQSHWIINHPVFELSQLSLLKLSNALAYYGFLVLYQFCPSATEDDSSAHPRLSSPGEVSIWRSRTGRSGPSWPCNLSGTLPI